MSRRKKKSQITSVLYTYVGTDVQFNEFLRMLLRDYLGADSPYTNLSADSVQRVESEVV